MASRVTSFVVGAVAIVLLAATGWCGAEVAKHLYDDHVLIDAARDADVQRLRQAAAELQKLQQQQQGQAAPAAPTAPPK